MSAMKKMKMRIMSPATVIAPPSAILLVAFAIAVALLVALTVSRNEVYRSTVSVWESMVRSSPNKRRPHQNYGQALSTAGNFNEALSQFQTVLSLPDDGSVPMRDTYARSASSISGSAFSTNRSTPGKKGWSTRPSTPA